MLQFISIFQFTATLLTLLAIYILQWVNKDHNHSKRILVLLLFTVGLMNLNGLLYQTRLYLQIPPLHKVLHPTSLLLAPLSFLYIRSVLLHEFTFRKKDWFIVIPSILYAINLVPYYIMPIEEKKAYLIEYYANMALRTKNANGILPSYAFPFIRFVWSLWFIVLNFKLVRGFVKRNTTEILIANSTTIQWIKGLNIMLASLLLTSLLPALTSVFLKTDFHVPDIAICFFALIITTTLFIKPNF